MAESEVKQLREKEFMECSVCIVKPGSPYLCESCLHNRTLINQLQASRRTLLKDVQAVAKIIINHLEQIEDSLE